MVIRYAIMHPIEVYRIAKEEQVYWIQWAVWIMLPLGIITGAWLVLYALAWGYGKWREWDNARLDQAVPEAER